jgi:hypothetical protein
MQNHRELPAINRTKLKERWESATSISTFFKTAEIVQLAKKKDNIPFQSDGRPSSVGPGSLHGLRVSLESHDAGGGNQTQ